MKGTSANRYNCRAIESHGGVKGCSAAVSQVSTSSQIVLKHNMIGIKSLSNFEFEAEGTTVFKVVILGRHARQRSELCIPLGGCRGEATFMLASTC